MPGRAAETIPDAIESLLAAARREEPLSLTSCVRALRNALGGCELTDAELAELVATHAVARGFPVVIFNMAADAAALEAEPS